MGGRRNGWAVCEVWVDRWAGLRVGFIIKNDMYNNDVGKGGAQGCEAHGVKKRVALVRVPFYFINLLPTSLLYISILLIFASLCGTSFR
jgi:hypothetical protein